MMAKADVYNIKDSPLYQETKKRSSALQNYVTKSSIELDKFYGAGFEAIGEDLEKLKDPESRKKFVDAVYKAAQERFDKVYKGDKDGKGKKKETFSEREAFYWMTGVTPESMKNLIDSRQDTFTPEYFQANIRNQYLEQLNERHQPYTVDNVNSDNVEEIFKGVPGGDKIKNRGVQNGRSVLATAVGANESLERVINRDRAA